MKRGKASGASTRLTILLQEMKGRASKHVTMLHEERKGRASNHKLVYPSSPSEGYMFFVAKIRNMNFSR